MKTFLTGTLLISLFVTGALWTRVWAQESEDPTAIILEKPVHFLTPDGSDVLVQPGTYRVESADNGLQLIPAVGNAQLIGADMATHDEEVDAPLAVSLAGKDE